MGMMCVNDCVCVCVRVWMICALSFVSLIRHVQQILVLKATALKYLLISVLIIGHLYGLCISHFH